MLHASLHSLKAPLIRSGFWFFKTSNLHRLLAPWARGLGIILTFHHVRPASTKTFQPNRLLEISPEKLDAILGLLKKANYDCVTMDEALERAAMPKKNDRRFVVLSFDDGYRDNETYALPILQNHRAPFILYVTTGFMDRTARLWWRELECVIERADHLVIDFGQGPLGFNSQTDQRKRAVFEAVYWRLRALPEPRALQIIADLCLVHKIQSSQLVERYCLDWAGIARMAKDPLCTIGCHTKSHPRLAHYEERFVVEELSDSREEIERRLGRSIRHLSYPVGDKTSADLREFALAARMGFASAVTTRPATLKANELNAMALPRVSVNGCYSDLYQVEIMLSGAPFLWRGGNI